MDVLSTWLDAHGLAVPILAAYYAALVPLALYGVHRLWLVGWALRGGRAGDLPAAVPSVWPRVTVQIPLYNESLVAARAIDAACRLDYPLEQLEVQVLDDSDDQTVEIVAERIAAWRAVGFAIEHLRRPLRDGFKAGALAEGERRARGELLAVFDADFVVPPDFLRRAVPVFSDPQVGCVQARWGHLNRGSGWLTRVQALLLDGHFAIEHAGRAAAGCFFNFNGTAGLWRRAAIRDAGGWSHDTLTEDLDLSYRAQLAGWRFVYLGELEVPAELPADLAAFKGQQDRWTRGSMQTARKLGGRLLAAPLAWSRRREALLHLGANLAYPLVVVLALLAPLALALRWGDPGWILLAVDLPLLLGGTIAIGLFFAASQFALGRSWWRCLPWIPVLMALGIGMSIHNARAALGGLWRSGGVFRRTPKQALVDGDEQRAGRERPPRATGSATVAARLGAVELAELALAAWLAVASYLALVARMWSAVPFLLLFLAGPALLATLALGRVASYDPSPGEPDQDRVDPRAVASSIAER